MLLKIYSRTIALQTCHFSRCLGALLADLQKLSLLPTLSNCVIYSLSLVHQLQNCFNNRNDDIFMSKMHFFFFEIF